MEKKFNITGICVPNKHYMVDISNKINIMIKMVSQGDYLVINKPRQFGKTTTLNVLENSCKNDYNVISISFEGAGDDLFSSEKVFCNNLLSIFSSSVRFNNADLYNLINEFNSINSFLNLSKAITDICSRSTKPIILIIDEIDKNSNSKIFLQFLGMLRAKYLAREAGKDKTFQSVILAGLHDIRNLKLYLRDEKESTFNSPWNIATKFEVDMSFSAEEIETMLLEYTAATNISFDIKLIAKMIHDYTNGYPYLVCDICKIIDEKLGKVWNELSIVNAVKQIVKEKNTLFEDVIKNLENNDDLKSLAVDFLLYGKTISYNQFAHEKGIMYGIFKEDNEKLVINNRIFEICIYNYLIASTKLVEKVNNIMESETSQFIINNSLDMEKILLKFQSFMYEEYRNEDISFYEKHGRLIFLAFLKPILNGKGFYFVEAQTRENKKMDIVITFGKEKYIVELKRWNGKAYQNAGKKQLCEYLDSQNVTKGYLVTFMLDKDKQKDGTWEYSENKQLFEILI